MARPQKDGVDYFSFDVDFFQDKKVKLIAAEFGDKGIVLLVRLLCEIYRTGGYYMAWDDDDCLLMSQGVTGGCRPTFIAEVVTRCAERSFFDKRVLDMFGVLTSKGIQRRYLKMVSNSRDCIPIIKEYWLLDNADPNDVTPGTLKKVTFKAISRKENPVNRKENPVNRKGNTPKKSKEKKSKENEIISRANSAVLEVFSRIKKPSENDARLLAEMIERYGEDKVISAIKKTFERGGRSVGYLAKVLETEDGSGVARPSCGTVGRYPPTYDIVEAERLMDEWSE